MAAFSDEEKRILANILPGVAAALRSPLNNLHMAAQRLTQPKSDRFVHSVHHLYDLFSSSPLRPQLANSSIYTFSSSNESTPSFRYRLRL